MFTLCQRRHEGLFVVRIDVVSSARLKLERYFGGSVTCGARRCLALTISSIGDVQTDSSRRPWPVASRSSFQACVIVAHDNAGGIQ